MFLRTRPRSEQIWDKGIFLTNIFGNMGTFLETLFRVKGMFLVRCCPCNKLFKGCSLGINHRNLCAQKRVQNLRTHLWDKGMFMMTRLRKGCNSTTMYFRDMGPFENTLFTHVNIGFNISEPPGKKHRLTMYQQSVTIFYILIGILIIKCAQ